MVETCTDVNGQDNSGGDFTGNTRTALDGAGDDLTRDDVKFLEEAARSAEAITQLRRWNMVPEVGATAILPMSKDGAGFPRQVDLPNRYTHVDVNKSLN